MQFAYQEKTLDSLEKNNSVFSSSFAAGLTGLRPVSRVVRSTVVTDDFRFRISRATSGNRHSEAFVSVVDAKGKEVSPDRSRVTVAAGRVLDAMRESRSQSGFMLGWDGVDSAVSLSRFPVVGTLLLDCHNVDVEGVGPVSTSIEPAKVSVELRRIADNDGNTLRFEPE